MQQLLALLALTLATWAATSGPERALAQSQSPAPTPRATPTDGCCARCIGKTTDLPYTYDPVVHSQCSAAKGVCCYGCGQDAAPQLNVVNGDFGADGVTPRVRAGAWAQLQWATAARVTYETFQATQKKISTVRNGSNEARASGGSFWVCAKTPGYIYVRGWGADACLSATKESKIEVIAGEGSNSGSTDSCGRLPTAAKASAQSDSGSSDDEPATKKPSGVGSAQALTRGDIEDTCNTQRASIVVNPDGTKECVCAAEWTGPPTCSGFPWWKIALTVGGAVAAALSILVSVKAYMSSRRAKQAKESLSMDDDPVLGASTMAMVGAPLSTRRSSHDGYERHQQREAGSSQGGAGGGGAVTSAREFSL